MAAGILVASIVLVCFMRPGADLKARRKAARSRPDIEIERGRSRISKDISRPSAYLIESTSEGTSGSQSSQ